MPYADPNKQRAYQRKWRAARHDAYFADKRCAECGSTHRLELHHRNPDEKVSHKIWSWSEERRLAELEKCDVLCHECHRNKTCEQMGWDCERKAA